MKIYIFSLLATGVDAFVVPGGACHDGPQSVVLECDVHVNTYGSVVA